ncbi:MAG: helicase-related protein [Conexivisphaera sp.]
MPPPGLRSYEWKTSYSDEDYPLWSFLVPALERSVRYDRAAGFFSSSVLSAAARGLSRLVRNGGRMRLITSVRLSREDAEALERGYSEREVVERAIERENVEPTDLFTRRRLEALAWLAATGRLEVKVALPRVGDRIVPSDVEIFHAKFGIFTDALGDQVSFSGSINESENAWSANIEYFSVFTSWGPDQEHHRDVVDHFERLWNDSHARARALDFTEAVRRKLISYAPTEPPIYEPEEVPALLQFLRDAPLLPNGVYLADAFLPFRPRPHQLAVANAVVENHPARFLLADEVGLGKTIETGIALRRLVLSGSLKRCLILVPASIMRQWQAQLREKFGLEFWRYDGDGFVDPSGRRLEPGEGNPLDGVNLVIMSAQLASRRSRRNEVLSARPWDMVVLDEAHHARRSSLLSFGQGERRGEPNLLLRLMEGLRERTAGLLLLTATPMQLDILELYDLLRLLDARGRWGSDEDAFAAYFQAVSSCDLSSAGSIVFEMARAYSRDAGDLEELIRRRLGPASLAKIRRVLSSPTPLDELRRLNEEERRELCDYLKRTTPLRELMFRHTRELLKRYREMGLTSDTFPERRITDVFVDLSDEERRLYDDIESYIADFYRRAKERNALVLKLVLEVMRRRLTSSTAAIRRTMERRLMALEAEGGGIGIVDEDLEEMGEVGEEIGGEEDDELRREEAAFLRRFIARLEQIGDDSKLKRFLEDLDQVLMRHERVLVFTQYTDTMDYIRDRIAEKYGRAVACYSGRGGEVYEGGTWRRVRKEEVERGLRGPVKILVGTDAMGEGLDLQSASAVINYDMPWNPMRVEQRIGRVDRIGQKAPEIEVINYFYRDTIEARIYRALNDRHELFTEVVGEAPQILARMERLIEEGITKPPGEREEWLGEEGERLLEEYEKVRNEMIISAEIARRSELPPPEELPPVTPGELGEFLLSHPYTRAMFSEIREGAEIREGVYRFSPKGRGERVVTFDVDVAEAGEAELFSYADLEDVLSGLPPPAAASPPRIVRVVARSGGRAAAGYFYSGPREIRTFSELRRLLASPDELAPLSDEEVEEAGRRVEGRLRQRLELEGARIRERRRLRLEGARLRCRAVLDKIVAVAILLDPAEPGAARKLMELARDGKYYASDLAEVANVDVSTYTIPEHVFEAYRGRRRESLEGELGPLTNTARDALSDYRRVEKEGEPSVENETVDVEVTPLA